MQHEHDATWHTYLVELYRPGSSVEALRRALRDVRQSATELACRGQEVAYLRSTIVPGDEAIMAMFEATSEDLVRETCARAGLTGARISQAIQPDGSNARRTELRERLAEGRRSTWDSNELLSY
jgi:hypothetical protein